MTDTDTTADIVEESTPAASSREPTLSAPTVSVAAPEPSLSGAMSNNNGWVKEHRKLLDWPLFKKPLTAHLWEYCRLRANHAAVDLWAGGERLHLEPGQFIIGRHAACEDTGLTDKQYRVAMLHLETRNA